MIIKICLLNNEIILKSQQRFKSKVHNVYTQEINKNVLSSNDDKRLQTLGKITTWVQALRKTVPNRIAEI